ncbi:MAG: D-2-hydroxyacid dehydrogenase [Planctomycetota bacterium]|jgi:phosphoglycerate dehydrogenase-like enzyme
MTILVWLTDPVVACWHFSEANHRDLAAAIPEAEVVVAPDREGFLEHLPKADVAIVWVFEQAWLDRAPRLRWIATPAAGHDYFTVVPPPGLRMTYGRFHGEVMAETVLAMILAHCRALIPAVQAQANDPWPRETLAPRMTTLRGSHLAILGFGNIGRWIGRLAKPTGVRITGIKRTPAPPPEYFDHNDRVKTLDALDDLLPSVDHLVVALPRDASTDAILDRRRLALLPSHATLTNVGRGNAIDEAALVEALEAKRLAGAYLDVFAREPLDRDHPLRSVPNAILLPHVSAVAPNYLSLFIAEFAEAWQLWRDT